MSNYWPKGLELTDTQSPEKILNDAKSEWDTNSEGLLNLILQKAESKSGYDMIIVHAKHVPSNRTASLFTVVCRKEQPYPARIEPKDEDLPDFFKKSYKTQDVPFAALGLAARQLAAVGEEKLVHNHWVADTPSEFRKKLQETFNLGIIKSEILNLISSEINDTNDEPEIEDTKEPDANNVEDHANDASGENISPSNDATKNDQEG